MSNTDKMRFYNAGRSVPKNAQKPFDNRRFTGTDINPMWRIKQLTEMFGPVGFGWYTEVTRQETVPADDGNVMAFVDINLYVKEGDTWSKPIFGTGGNMLKVKGRGDDDGFKKAYTDALSIACKALGIGADIWYSADAGINADYSSKYADRYTDAGTPSKPAATAPNETPATSAKPAQSANSAASMATDDQKEYIRQHANDDDYMTIMQDYGAELEALTYEDALREIRRIDDTNMRKPTCTRCGKPIGGKRLPDGTQMTPAEIVGKSKLTYGGVYCWDCMMILKRTKAKEEAEK